MRILYGRVFHKIHPVAYSVTQASAPDINAAHDLLDETEKTQPSLLKKAETLTGDRGYDDTKLKDRKSVV